MKECFCLRGILSTEEYETAVAGWYGLGMLGCEESAQNWSTAEFRVYFASEKSALAAASDLRGKIRRCSTVEVTRVADDDWNARWRSEVRPVLVSPGVWVSPPWLPPPLAEGDHWIKIEPKMAFGTGHHESTRLAAKAIAGCRQNLSGGSLLDIGTGSGILCFSGIIAGAASCAGIEIDPECADNLSENRTFHRDGGSISFMIGTVGALKTGARFDVIVMNMIHTESAPILPDCHRLLAGSGCLIWSGILDEERERAIKAAEEKGFLILSGTAENEWWCGIFRKDHE